MTPLPPALVTIGLPVFNGERFLRQSLDSLLAQRFRDFELIISDNASTDHTPEICAEYLKIDSRVSYYRQPSNCGAFANTESIIRRASGRYYMFVGDDDVYDPAFISTLVPILESDPGVGLAFTDFSYIRCDGTVVANRFRLHVPQGTSRFLGLAKFLRRRSALPMMLGLFRREVLLQVLPFPERELAPMTGDLDNVLLTRILTRAAMANVKEALCYYRIKDRSGSYPPDWPSSAASQMRYILSHHLRVAALMRDAINSSDLPLLPKASLFAINRAAMVALFVEYCTRRLLNAR